MIRNQNILVLSDQDNVGVMVTADGPVEKGHKVALCSIPVTAPVIKYGHVIGIATEEIKSGDHVHTHNMRMPQVGEFAGGMRPKHQSALFPELSLPGHFRGYRRQKGRAGTRNYIVVVASVNCSATVVRKVTEAFSQDILQAKGIDGIIPVTHGQGCAQAVHGLGYQVLNRTLAGWIFHPNVVGAVVIGLGCEVVNYESIMRAAQEDQREGDAIIRHFGIQDVGGTSAAIHAGVQAVRDLLDQLSVLTRQDIPVSELVLALNCGGSDGLSGLTANPLLGQVTDWLVALGGGSVLAEIPECHGAEGLLLGRCTQEKTKKKLEKIFAFWADYALRHRVSLNNNLALGNLKGGISTIVEKSLGAVAKAGTAPLMDAVEYSEPIRSEGFVIMNTPGYDPTSVTGLVAGGCNLVAFTTGRGSTFGCAIAPTVKIATNREVFRKMSGDMDFDAGRLLEEGAMVPLARELFEMVIAVASGQTSKSEDLGLGRDEFVPWAVGETL